MTNKVPNIRFKGFTDDWEQRKLSEVSDVRDGTHDSPSYLSQGHPFVTSKNVKDGYINYEDIQYISDEDFEAINKRSKVDVNDILMGMIGTIGNLALIRTEPDFAIKNVALIKDTKQISYLYLYHYLQSPSTEKQLLLGLDGGTQKFVSLKNIRDLNVIMPAEAEQVKVGTFFESLKNLITLHQRKCEQTKELKKFMLQKMFPKKGEKNPEIRFPGFTDDWEQRKFGELYEKVSRKNDMTYGTEQIISVANMYYKVDANVKRQDYLKTYNIFELGDIAFEGNKSKHFAHGRFVENTIGNGIVSHVFDVFKPIMDFNLSFWKYYINYEGVMGPILTRVTKASTMMTNLVAKDFLNEDILVPSIAEQQKIGEYLSNLDHLITLHQRKVFYTLKHIFYRCCDTLLSGGL